MAGRPALKRRSKQASATLTPRELATQSFQGPRHTFRGGPRHSSLLTFTSTLVCMELARETGTGPFRCPRSGCKGLCRPSGEASTRPVLLGALLADQRVLDRTQGRE